ncbi:MAG: single-stranded DNA-binding protein [Clostridia bacterium]|nr:single-stranded DNA-binding protein [Clostridia bacterium]
MANNKVFLQGVVETIPELNHVVKYDEFYGFNLSVSRLSGQTDIIPIIISKQMVDLFNIKKGDYLAVRGQFRSFNKIENEKRKLILSVFVKEVCEWDDDANPNVIELNGFVCKPVIYRTTPFSREICDVLLAVNRKFNKSDYIPCIAWGNNAQLVSQMGVPTNLKIVGRIQSREYNKVVEGEKSITKTAYEVSISKLVNE